MVSLSDYFMGRRETYPLDLTPEIEANAIRLLDIVNRLIIAARLAGVDFEINPKTKTLVSSGWRPPSINAATPDAAPKSKHMLGLALDIYDPDGDFDDWLTTTDGQRTLETLGLWMEHPSATKGWSHLQSIPPKSKKRVFYP